MNLQNIQTTPCECCSELTYHIPLGEDDISYDHNGFTLHLTHEEAKALRIQLATYL